MSPDSPEDETPEQPAPPTRREEQEQPPTEDAALRSAIAEVGASLELGERAVDGLTRHAEAVLLANRSFNLTRLVEPHDVAHLQVEDSLRLGAALPLAGSRVLDLGSGAGYPGIPMAYLEPSAEVWVIDSRRKKAEFLASTIALLERGNLHAKWARGEQVLGEGQRFDVVVARAVGSVAKVLSLLRPVRHRFGVLALAKGPRLEEELDDARELLKPRLFRLREIDDYELGGGGGTRRIAYFEAGEADRGRWARRAGPGAR